MGKGLVKGPPSAGNIKPPGYVGLVLPQMADFDILHWNHNVNNLVNTKELPAELYRIPSYAPVPWYNLNPISMGIHEMSNPLSYKTNLNNRQGNNRF